MAYLFRPKIWEMTFRRGLLALSSVAGQGNVNSQGGRGSSWGWFSFRGFGFGGIFVFCLPFSGRRGSLLLCFGFGLGAWVGLDGWDG